MIPEFSMEEAWHPSKEKTDLRLGTATCLSPANADTTFDSLSNLDQTKKSRAGMISLITASHQSLSAEVKTSLPKLPFQGRKQYFINRVPTVGSEEQSSGTSLWIISTARDKPTALGHQQ